MKNDNKKSRKVAEENMGKVSNGCGEGKNECASETKHKHDVERKHRPGDKCYRAETDDCEM